MSKEKTPPSSADSLVSSILPALSTEGRDFLQPSFRRSQSATALAVLQKEVDNLDQSKVGVQDHEEEKKILDRCISLPHLKWKGVEVSRPSNGDGDNIDNISITSAAKSEDRVKEMETDLADARDTIQSLRDTVLDQRGNISSLTCQLNDECDASKTLREELHVSRQLCMELNAASRPSSESEKSYCSHTKVPERKVAVREVALQVALGDHDCTMNANGAKNASSPDFVHKRSCNQEDDWKYSHFPRCPILSGRKGIPEYDSIGRLADIDITHQLHTLHQHLREKEFQIEKLTDKLSKYLQRNAELEAEQMSQQENLETAENKLVYRDQEVTHLKEVVLHQQENLDAAENNLVYRDQEVTHLKEVVLHQQEDIALLEQIKEDLHCRCSDLEKREQDLEELVDSLNDDMNGIAKERKKMSRHIKELNSSLETKQIEITTKVEELEAQSNLLDVIKQVAFGSPSRKKHHTPRSVTSTPRNSPAGPTQSSRRSTDQKNVIFKVQQECDPDAKATEAEKTDEREHRVGRADGRNKGKSSDRAEGRNKGKSSDRIPSKQERRHASRSLNYNECAHPGETASDSDPDADGGYRAGSDDDDGDSEDLQPINGFYNDSYVSSSEDIRGLLCPTSPILAEHGHQENPEYETKKDPTTEHGGDDLILVEEQKFQQDLSGNHSSPKSKEEQGVDELIAEVLAELAEEEKCEADKSPVPAVREKELALPTKMESEGLLLRKHELENYAMRAKDRSWQYMYVVQHGSQLWFYESKEHHQQGTTYDGEGPLDLTDANVHVAPDYTKRKFVFRVQLPNDQRFLFQARDDREMLFWVCSMDSSTGRHQSTGDTFNGVTPGIGVIPPPVTGSPSKTDRLRNMIKGSISALTK